VSKLCRSAPALLHPATLAALALWALNDHVLKGWAPGLLTGKLSDVSGLVVGPTVLLGLVEWVAPQLVRERARAVLAACCLALGLLALGLELWTPVMLAYQHALSSVRWAVENLAGWSGGGRPYALVQNTPDLSDLCCLPALAVPWWLVQRTARRFHAAPSAPVS
jgi:hypothetical protein